MVALQVCFFIKKQTVREFRNFSIAIFRGFCIYNIIYEKGEWKRWQEQLFLLTAMLLYEEIDKRQGRYVLIVPVSRRNVILLQEIYVLMVLWQEQIMKDP